VIIRSTSNETLEKSQSVDLKQLIAEITSPNPSAQSGNRFIKICQKIAAVHLDFKANKRHLDKSFFGTNLESLAITCIADVFARNEDGSFFHVQEYFSGFTLHSLTTEDALSHLRRFICSKANNGLYRLYMQHDSTLSKILRNVQNAFQSLQNFVVVERVGELYVAPVFCETQEHLPELSREEIVESLQREIRGNENVPQLVSKFLHYFREQENYSRFVSLLTLAYAFRTLYFEQKEYPSPHPDNNEKELLTFDVQQIVDAVCKKLYNKNHEAYVASEKVREEIFQRYCSAVRQQLTAKILLDGEDDFTLMERMQNEMPGLTCDEYKKFHKGKVEYLFSLARQQAMQQFREWKK